MKEPKRPGSEQVFVPLFLATSDFLVRLLSSDIRDQRYHPAPRKRATEILVPKPKFPIIGLDKPSLRGYIKMHETVL